MRGSGTQLKERADSRTVRVFVSSTWLDLGAERKAVEEVLQRFRETKFVGMEYFGSSGTDTQTASLDALDRCQLYVGIVGDRYGSGITEAEYEKARTRGLACLIYMRAALAQPAGDHGISEVERFRSILRRSHTVSEFRNPDELAAHLAADLHNWLFDSWLAASFVQESVEGIVALPADYASRIQNFLVEYLGSGRAPVPFGGRAADMARLDAWVDASEPPYALVAAPAGRGKSALVARWTSSLLARPGTTVIFMPVSIRFRTNLASVVFASLAARLASVFGEELPAMAETTVEVWRALVTSYLRRWAPGGGRIVVVVDGLDEAADWEAGADLFPADPPAGVKVIVTARFRAGDADGRSWLETLGWGGGLATVLDLPSLTSEGVSDVLARMGAPLDRVAANVDITGELFRLSEGDPLLVRLYADDLWSRGERAASLSPADLRAIRPGLEGYFQRWWREQKMLWGKDTPLRTQAVQTLLNLLACALGPLTIEDLMQTAPEESGLSTWTVEDALQPLARFIVGDGRTHGFVFSHPRLAIYFHDQLSAAERRLWERHFIEWGRRTLAVLKAAPARPAEPSRYLIQYFGAHLERSGAGPDELFSLVEDAWRLAWLAYEGSYSGFLNDVRRAWRATDAADAEHLRRGEPIQFLGASIQCALCFASVRSLASNILPRLLQALVESSLWTGAQALAFLRENPSDENRAAGLAAVAGRLPETLLEQAIEISSGQVSVQLVRRLAECARGARALELIGKRSHDVEWQVQALTGAGPLLKDEEVETALEIASRLPSASHIAVALAVAKALTAERREPFLRRVLTSAIAEAFPERISAVAALLKPEIVWEVMQNVRYPTEQASKLLVLATLLEHVPQSMCRQVLQLLQADLGRYLEGPEWSLRDRQQVVTNLLPLVDAPTRERLLTKLVRERPSEDIATKMLPFLRVEHLRVLLHAGREEAQDRLDLWKVLSSVIPEGMWDELMDVLLSGEVHAGALAHLLSVLPEHAVRRAYDKAVEMWDESAVRALAPRLTLEQLQGLQEWMDITWNRADCAAVAARYAQLGEWQRALDVFDTFKGSRDNSGRSDSVLVEVCHALRGNREGLSAALMRAKKAADPPGVLNEIAGDLPTDLLREAISMVQQVADTQTRDRIRTALGTALTKTGDARRGVTLAYSGAANKWGDWLRQFQPEQILGVLRQSDDPMIQKDSLEILLGPLGLNLVAGTDGTVRWGVAECLLCPSGEPEKVESFIEGLHDPEQQAAAIEILARRLTEQERESMARVAMEIADSRSRAEALLFLLKYTGPDRWWVEPSWPASLRTRTVRELIVFASGSEQSPLLEWCLECACSLAAPDDAQTILIELHNFAEELRARALSIIVPKLGHEDWRDAWILARRIRELGSRARAMSCLLPYAPASDSDSAAADALASAVDWMRETTESEVFLTVCQNMHEANWAEAWAEVPTIAATEGRLEALVALLEHAPEGMRVSAGSAAVEIAKQAGHAPTPTWIRIANAAVEPSRSAAWREAWKAALSRIHDSPWEAIEVIKSAPACLVPEFADDVAASFWEGRRNLELVRVLYSRLQDPMPFLQGVVAKGATSGRHPEHWAVLFPRAAVLDWLAAQNDGLTMIRVVGAVDWSIDDDGTETTKFLSQVTELVTRVSDPESKTILDSILQEQVEARADRRAQAAQHDTATFALAATSEQCVRDYAGLTELLRRAAQSTRAQMIDALESNLGWIQDVVGLQALEQTADAVERVYQWWP